jgi:hypothetical protein
MGKSTASIEALQSSEHSEMETAPVLLHEMIMSKSVKNDYFVGSSLVQTDFRIVLSSTMMAHDDHATRKVKKRFVWKKHDQGIVQTNAKSIFEWDTGGKNKLVRSEQMSACQQKATWRARIETRMGC